MAYIPPLNGGRLNASIGGNSTSAGAGYKLVSTGTILLAGGNNVTLSQNGGSITISAANAPSGSINFSASNASANLASVNFGNANGVSFGLNGSTITASHNALTSQSNQALSAANGSFAFQTASFSNANGISFGTSAGSAITASHNALTSQSNQALSGSNGSFAFQTATFGNLNGMSFYTSNGSLVGSYTVPTQTNQTLSQAVTGNTTGNTSGMSMDARSMTLQGLGAASVGISTSAGGSSVIVSVPTNYLTTARASTDAIGLNTAQTNVTWTVNSAGLSLNAAGYAGTGFSGTNASGTLNSNGLQLSVGTGGGGVAMYDGINTITSGTASFADANGVSFGINGQTITGSVAAQSVQTQNMVSVNGSTGNISFDNGGNVGFGANGSTITASYNQTNQSMGMYAVSNTIAGQGTSTSLDARSLSFNGMGNVSVGYSNGSVLISGSGAGGGGGGIALGNSQTVYSTGTAYLNDGNGGNGAITISSAGQSFNFSVPQTSSLSATGDLNIVTSGGTISMGVPYIGTVSNWEPVPLQNATLSSAAVGQKSVLFMKIAPQAYISASQLMQLISVNMASVNSSHKVTIGVGAGMYTASGSTLSLITQSSGTASYSWSNSSTNNASGVNGLRGLTLPMNVSMAPGNYWLGMWSSSTYSNTSAAVPVNMLLAFGPTGSYSGQLLQASNITQGIQEGVGIYSSAPNALPSSAAMSNITQAALASLSMPYIVFKNQTW